jgi:hypothetical protein
MDPVYRRFGYLHARVAAEKQDELRTLEEELDGAENEQQSPASVVYTRGRYTRDPNILDECPGARKALLETIDRKLSAYGTQWPLSCCCFVLTNTVR